MKRARHVLPFQFLFHKESHPVTKKYIAIGSKAHGPTIALYYLLLECTEKHLHALENGILLPKLFLPTVRKNCSSDQQFIQTVKGQNNFW